MGEVAILVPLPGQSRKSRVDQAADASDATPLFPILFALHGRGEALKPAREGAMGWPRDYALLQALQRIAEPPIVAADGLGAPLSSDRLREINGGLGVRPYGGMIVVCPYLPDIDLRREAPQRACAAFIVETLLPLVRARLPVIPKASATGIDGVSLGGALALFTGLRYPETFRAIGGIQPAIQAADADSWCDRVRAARQAHPQLALRLLTTDKDYFRDGVFGASRAMQRAHLNHELIDIPGPHDYAFNRGPGAFELLWFHHRTLRT
jgi:iron(III)-salmochelin esterase